MSNKKTHVLSIRVSEDLKQCLEKAAEDHAMDLSQYAKYLLVSSVEGENIRENKHYKCLDWLEENYRLIGRMIIEGFLKTDALAEEQFKDEKEYLKSITDVSRKIFKKQGISKKDGEKYW